MDDYPMDLKPLRALDTFLLYVAKLTRVPLILYPCLYAESNLPYLPFKYSASRDFVTFCPLTV